MLPRTLIVNVLHAVSHPLPTLAVSDIRCAHGSHSSHATLDRSEHEREKDERCAYRVAWSLNAHTRIGAADPERAAHQHRSFVETLQAAGAKVLRLPFVHGAYDCVFSKDNAVLLERGDRRSALLARPLHPERRIEQAMRREALECHGFHVMEPPAFAFEGGDVVVHPGATGAFLGFGERSDRRAADSLSRFLDAPVIALELVDKRFFHLDLALTVLSDGTALVCPEAFAPGAIDVIANAEGITDVTLVPTDEALSFALNLVEVGDWVIAPAHSETVSCAVAQSGRRLVVTPLDEFLLAGGGAACLVAQVHRRAAHTSRSTRSSRTSLHSAHTSFHSMRGLPSALTSRP